MKTYWRRLVAAYRDSRHWWWDKREERMVRLVHKALGHYDVVYVHEHRARPHTSVIVSRRAWEELIDDVDEEDGILFNHSHLEGL